MSERGKIKRSKSERGKPEQLDGARFELGHFEKWAAAARAEQPPRIDVAERVRASVERLAHGPIVYAPGVYRGPRSAWQESPLLMFAGASLVAAALVAAVALPAWESVQDPLVAFCRPFSNLLE